VPQRSLRGRSGARHPRRARAPRRLRVAPGGSAPPIPCVARRGHGGARSGRESRLFDRTGKRLLQSCAYHRRNKRSSQVNDDRSVFHSLRGCRHTGRRRRNFLDGSHPFIESWLTKQPRLGSIQVRQCPARSGTFLGEAIRPAISAVALHITLRGALGPLHDRLRGALNAPHSCSSCQSEAALYPDRPLGASPDVTDETG
jgi:hypothetical protein